jgi:hypothetical protein
MWYRGILFASTRPNMMRFAMSLIPDRQALIIASLIDGNGKKCLMKNVMRSLLYGIGDFDVVGVDGDTLIYPYIMKGAILNTISVYHLLYFLLDRLYV